jgi:hypothetical protein
VRTVEVRLGGGDRGAGVDVEIFIQRWTAREGGAERANYQMFLAELCDVIGVGRPDPAGAERSQNDYVFERAVDSTLIETGSVKRIDLYKRGAFILEAKQSRLPGKKNALPGQLSLLGEEPEQLGRRSLARGWDVLMKNAFNQARDYAHLLPTDHAAPPFLIVADVGHCFELYADFSGTGRGYSQFPDRQSFRLYMEDLRDEKVRARLAAIWTDPAALDPTRESVRVTRAIADRLAQVSKALETDHAPEEVAHFLMRCIFTMFAEDVDLLPRGEFTRLLKDCIDSPDSFAPLLNELWAKMDEPDHEKRFFSFFKARLRHFNGNLFRNARAFPLGREEIGELLAAAKSVWTEVDPAIFGTLLEQALDPAERRKLGAHYTPRAYVERLVGVTVMEPLRADWQAVLTKAEDAVEADKREDAVRFIRAFHHQLCATRVLDPACGTGNFLYVSLELMKRLEGEVLERLAELGETETIGLETVDPHQFLGLELNPRAAAIAELVVWIGYLQQHYRNSAIHPAEPILRAFENINFGRREGYDAVLTWDGYPLTTVVERGGARVETYPNARRPVWPEAEFIVGNPPFIGGKDLRSRMAPGYAEALWAAHPQMNESADFVMYWWDRSAEILGRKKTLLRRFGLVTTNSISQVFQRRVMERHLNAKAPIGLVFAIPDHPWTKATRDSAAVRIAMTVADGSSRDGILLETTTEERLETDEPRIGLQAKTGRINSDLTVGVDVTKAPPLLANEGLCSPGVKLHGAGFIVTPQQAELLGLGKRLGLEKHIRDYRNGRDLMGRSRGVMVIDLNGLSSEEVRSRYPETYQHVLEHVKPERDRNNEAYRRDNWWLFGRRNTLMRGFTEGTQRYVATVETSKHRVFLFLDRSILPDNKLVNFGLYDAALLSILSSRIHYRWYAANSAMLGVYDQDAVYVKSRCFDPFPFPDPSEDLKARLRALGEELDATRKRVQAEHPDLTLTGLYNVLEKLKAGAPLTAADEDVKQRGLVLILKELHEQIDALTADAYGWPRDLTDEQILERLVALNAERAKEEAAGHVRWLRPDYQIPRFAKGAAAKSGQLDLGETVVAIDKGLPVFPKDRYEQPLAVEAALIAAARPMDAAELARGFKGRAKGTEQRIAQVLTTLARYGRVTALDGGRYAARRAA